MDDERYIVDLLSDLLEDEGYRVERAYDGVAALEQVSRNPPDLIVADVMMPRLDGLSLADEINSRGLDIPIILMSAAVTPRTDHVAFIPKPFDIDAMLHLIERLLSE
ncbi:MAG: response regulator [Chloroflexota bacterium]|nr:response regulator [Chloroflexota bacterium]